MRLRAHDAMRANAISAPIIPLTQDCTSHPNQSSAIPGDIRDTVRARTEMTRCGAFEHRRELERGAAREASTHHKCNAEQVLTNKPPMRAPRACVCVCWVQSQAHLQRVLDDRSNSLGVLLPCRNFPRQPVWRRAVGILQLSERLSRLVCWIEREDTQPGRDQPAPV